MQFVWVKDEFFSPLMLQNVHGTCRHTGVINKKMVISEKHGELQSRHTK